MDPCRLAHDYYLLKNPEKNRFFLTKALKGFAPLSLGGIVGFRVEGFGIQACDLYRDEDLGGGGGGGSVPVGSNCRCLERALAFLRHW